ncbi:MAG: thioredoxin-like domain-containing protein [Armatimonadota bacterium]|jgi:thiol-disulfide isomerase/thioredoxin
MRRRIERAVAPEFPENLRWLNVEEPLRLRHLRGRLVLLNFWTACCINCMHVIPELNQLARSHSPELVVIGVHSPMCTAEREIEQLRLAVRRLGIEYPVVNDRDMRAWKAFEVQAWPTSILIGTEGYVVARLRGDGLLRAFDETIGGMIRDATRSGGIERGPIGLTSTQAARADGGLSFPGAILAHERSDRLFISDTGNNRIVVTGLDGEVLDVAGTGEVGFADGSFDEASFSDPQGAALDGQMLYVADRGNHAIRRLDLGNRTVRTIAGTGRQAPAMIEPREGRLTDLSSPWDLEVVHHRLYITMSGLHQIWRLDLHSGDLEVYAGGGAPGFLDGTRSTSALAQPAGLSCDGIRLFFTDAGTSSLRWAYLPPGVQLGTWVGQGLFEYGDRDGIGREALLQFPLGLVHHAGEIYVADTYNNRIKRFNPGSARIETLLGAGVPGCEDGRQAAFNEPRDVSCADGRLWIADTNNHAIRVAPLDGGPVSTLRLHPLERLRMT